MNIENLNTVKAVGPVLVIDSDAETGAMLERQPYFNHALLAVATARQALLIGADGASSADSGGCRSA